MALLELKNINFSYQQEKAVENVRLSIEEGDFVAFIGPNGSGKSTLLKLILGYLTPDKGEILWQGQPASDVMDWSSIGYISQQVKEFNQSFPATVREIVGSNLYNKMGFIKFLNSSLEEKIAQALKLVDMEGFMRRKIGNLSGGQQQRVFIARLMVNDPDLIILDEPLVGLDIKAQDDFYRIIGEIKEKYNKTIIMVSHDIQVISRHANRVVCFEEGQVYSHRAREFSYDDYMYDLRQTNLRIIPRHEH